jgi:hypothetical protein
MISSTTMVFNMHYTLRALTKARPPNSTCISNDVIVFAWHLPSVHGVSS